MRFLSFTLRGPLQSWGERSHWDSRDTAAMPAKSGVIGLLGCCLGWPRGDERLRALNDSLHLAVRAERPGHIMTDYHTVQTEYGKFPNAAGGERPGNTIITPKQYLQDAAFTVFLWGDEETLDACGEALRHPRWVPYLGRRSCVPSVPLIPRTVEASCVEEALSRGFRGSCPAEIELLPGERPREHERVIRRPDTVVDASRNMYQYRTVRAFQVEGDESACS